jgi:hypothetical protein
MIIRATKKTMDKIKLKEFNVDSVSNEMPLNEWYLNHFKLDRKGYFILTESISLFSIIEESVGISNLNILKNWLEIVFRKFEKDNSLSENAIDTKNIVLLKTNNKKILGSQNELIRMAENIFYYDDENYEDLGRVNNTPMMYTKSFPQKDIISEINRRKNF